uniref:Putative serine protease n=1 Tax=Haematobia irritans TaxID=7368 RepID=A0A1L8EII6_HAEIR
MKLTLQVLTTLTFVVVLTKALSLQTTRNKDIISHNEPVFVKSLKKLYQGPPVQEAETKAKVQTNWITQKLDHFNSSETRTWQMRYMVNDKYFKPGGPMFIHVGGEWDISPSGISSGIFVDLAKEHNGLLFYTEHRYYGKSKPTKDLMVENLKYLHVKQALADLAHFIEYQRETVTDLANSKVIMSGGSYSATMVVWFKKLYPHLLNGGWASSAPLLAKLDFEEYMEVVGKSWHTLGGDQCYQRIENGIGQFEEMISSKRTAEVKAMLKLCNNFDMKNDLDIWTLFSTFAYIFAGIAQYQKGDDIKSNCNYLMSFEDDLTALTKFWLRSFEGEYAGCTDVTYKDTLNFFKDTSYDNGWARPWYYQTCNEYGWYQTSKSQKQPFGRNFPIELSTTLCRDAYGPKYFDSFIQQMIDETNEFFGGLNPEVENIYMTHGSLDPWNPMGHGELQGAVMLPNASHCADVGSISALDSPEMRKSKERLGELVRQWLSDA